MKKMKTWVYVLRCQAGKFYVGSTRDLPERLQSHFLGDGFGSNWTMQYKPVEVLRCTEVSGCPLALEKAVTIQLMLEHGWENVAGSSWCSGKRPSWWDPDSKLAKAKYGEPKRKATSPSSPPSYAAASTGEEVPAPTEEPSSASCVLPTSQAP